MSWSVERLSTWTSAGGRAEDDLGFALEGSEYRREIGDRSAITLVLDRHIAWELVKDRAIVRVTFEDRTWREFRCMSRRRATLGPEGQRCTVQAYPRIYDLADSDLVRETVGGREVFTFDVNLTLAEYGTRFLLANQTADQLQGIVLGPFATLPQRIPLQWTRLTRGELLDRLLAASFGELVWRIREDGLEELDIVADTGIDATEVPLCYGDRLADHGLEEDWSDVATVFRLAGEAPVPEAERASFAENAWRVTATEALSGGRVALTLREISGVRAPILEDGQWAAHPELGLPARYVQRADGITRREILGSSAANGTIIVSAGGAPTVGERVCIVATSAGDPLELLELPQSIARYGRVVADLIVPGGRGERQYAVNAGHEDGITGWAPVNGGVGVDFPRPEMGQTITGAANGSRAAGTGTGTPFALKGLGAGRAVRQTDRLIVEGAVCELAANAVSNPDSTIDLTLESPGLPGSYADGAEITLVREDQRTLEVAIELPRGGLNYVVDGTNVAELIDYSATNDLQITGPNGEQYLPDTGADVRVYRWPGVADRCVLQVGNGGWTGGPAESPLGLHAISAVSVVSALRLACTLDPTWQSGVLHGVGGFVTINVNISGPEALVEALPPWLRRPLGAGFQLTAQVVSNTGGVVTIDVVGVPAGTTFVGLSLTPRGNWYPLLPDPPLVSALTSWQSTFEVGEEFEVIRRKERRTLLFDGSHSLGDTSITLRPLLTQLAQLARRDWLSTDTVYTRRTLSAHVQITAFDDVTLEATINTANSTLDEIDSADRDNITILWIPATAIALELTVVGGMPPGLITQWPWRVVSIAGSVMQLAVDLASLAGMFGVPQFDITIDSITDLGGGSRTITALWTREDSYPLSSTASWNSDGIAALPITVPSGRTLQAGQPLWANWLPGSDTPLLAVSTTVVGPASSVSVRGDCAYRRSWDGVSAAALAVYRVFATGTVLDVPGDVLVAAATVIANGSGEAAVPLVSANTNAIAADAVVRIERPVMLRPTDRQTGSLMRLTCAVGGTGQPTSSSPGRQPALQDVRVPTGSTAIITVRAAFRLSVGDWLAGEGPVVALVNESGTILGWSALGDDGVLIDTEAGQVMLTAQASIAQSGRYGFRVYGGPASDLTRWVMHEESMFYVGASTSAPYTTDSYPSQMLLAARRAIGERTLPRISDTLTVEDLAARYADALGLAGLVPPLVIGGRVHIEPEDRRARITVIVSRPGTPIADVQIGQVYRDSSRLLADAALAAGVRGLR